MDKVKFIEMKDGDKEDYDLLAKFEDKYIEGTADRVIRILKSLDSSLGSDCNITIIILLRLSSLVADLHYLDFSYSAPSFQLVYI